MYKIITYYTSNYKEVFEKYLMPSLNKLNLDYLVIEIENLGSHQKNANYKPQFIYDALNKLNTDIVFLDADAEVLQNPILFNTLTCDIACHLLDWNSWYNKTNGQKEALPGTLFVKNNDKMKLFIKKWAELAKDSYKWDGHILQEMLKEDKSIVFYNLPLSYCYIKTLPDGKFPRVVVKEPIIVHNQISRIYRNKK